MAITQKGKSYCLCLMHYRQREFRRREDADDNYGEATLNNCGRLRPLSTITFQRLNARRHLVVSMVLPSLLLIIAWSTVCIAK